MLNRPLSACLAAILLALTVLARLAAAAPTDAVGFTDYVLGKLTAAAPGTAFAIREPLLLDVTFPGGGGIGLASLDRIWRYCAINTEPACEQAIDYWVAGTVSPTMPEQRRDRSAIRVVVRTASVLADYAAQVKQPAISAPLAGDLHIACVFDTPTSMSYLADDDLGNLGLTADEAIALGIRNVVANLRPLDKVLRGDPADPWAHSDGDDYESSRISAHDSFAELSAAWGGRLVVAVPGTHVVLYADGRRKDALPSLRKAVEKVMNESEREISATLLLWTRTGWEVIPPLRATLPPAVSSAETR